MWNHDRFQFAEAEANRHKMLFSQASKSYVRGQYGAALKQISPILHSKHVGPEVGLLYDRVLGALRDKVDNYTRKIQADPKDPNNYLRRAQQYFCLDDDEKVHADMKEYRLLLNPPKGIDAYDDWLKNLVNQESPSGFLFGIAENLGPPVNSPDLSDYEWGPRVHFGGLSITIHRNFEGESERWVYTRPSKYDPWDVGIRMDTLPKTLIKGGNIIPGWTTMDGLELYIANDLPGGYGNSDIYVRTREILDTYFSQPVNIGPTVNTRYGEALPSISSDGLKLYFSDYDCPRPGGFGGQDLWFARRNTRNDPWQEPINLGENVNSPASDSRPHISVDGLFLFFDSNRSEGYGGSDLYVTKRKSLSDPWGEAMNLGPRVNSPTAEYNPCISSDGRELFFVRNDDIWQVPIITIEGNTYPHKLSPSAGQLRQSVYIEDSTSKETIE
jgi:hypothetical protein